MSDAFRKGLEAQSASMHEFKDEPSAARLHRFTPVYGEWPQCDLCGEREDAPIHKQPEEPSAASPWALN